VILVLIFLHPDTFPHCQFDQQFEDDIRESDDDASDSGAPASFRFISMFLKILEKENDCLTATATIAYTILFKDITALQSISSQNQSWSDAAFIILCSIPYLFKESVRMCRVI